MDFHNKIKSLLFGLVIGDALGVPFEFRSRAYLKYNPVEGMTTDITFNKPLGTFSDDSSLSFTLVESLIKGYDLNDIAQNIVRWYDEGYWSSDGIAYGVGYTTRIAIRNIQNNIGPLFSGEVREMNNGNGSLMRVAPLVFILKSKDIEERFKITKEVSSITHAHLRSSLACFYYLEFLRHILENKLNKYEIYHKLQKDIPKFLDKYFKTNVFRNEKYYTKEEDYEFYKEEIQHFNRLLEGNIYELDKKEIKSDLYVVDTIQASIWCLLTEDNYKESVLKAVNLGGDTDTTASVTGALAGLLYGFESIPKKWVKTVARSNDIEELAIRFADSFI